MPGIAIPRTGHDSLDAVVKHQSQLSQQATNFTDTYGCTHGKCGSMMDTLTEQNLHFPPFP